MTFCLFRPPADDQTHHQSPQGRDQHFQVKWYFMGKREEVGGVLVEDELTDLDEQSEQNGPVATQYTYCNSEEVESEVFLQAPSFEHISHLKS